MTSRFSATWTSCSRRPPVRSAISARRNRAELDECGRVVPAMIEDVVRAGAAVHDRTAQMARELLVAHRRVRAERDEDVEGRCPGADRLFEEVEHGRHRHGARAVRDDDENALAVERQACQTVPHDRPEGRRRQHPQVEFVADDAHRAVISNSPCRTSRTSRSRSSGPCRRDSLVQGRNRRPAPGNAFKWSNQLVRPGRPVVLFCRTRSRQELVWNRFDIRFLSTGEFRGTRNVKRDDDP